jgi:3-methylcrotonyl-CoA carboxylase alpha subunit
VKIVQVDGPEVLVEDGARRYRVFVAANGATRWAFWEGQVWEIQSAPPGRGRRRASTHDLLAAPMPATVLRLAVGRGDRVAKGDTVLVLEAMKMELPLRAPRDGEVVGVHCQEGELVQPGVTLMEIE